MANNPTRPQTQPSNATTAGKKKKKGQFQTATTGQSGQRSNTGWNTGSPSNPFGSQQRED